MRLKCTSRKNSIGHISGMCCVSRLNGINTRLHITNDCDVQGSNPDQDTSWSSELSVGRWIASCLPLGMAKVNQWRRGDKRHRYEADSQKSGAHKKTCHSSTTFTGYETTFTFFFYLGQLSTQYQSVWYLNGFNWLLTLTCWPWNLTKSQK